MGKTWVMAADSSKAKVYSAEKPNSALREVTSFDHPEGRMHEQDLTSDLPGRAFDSHGPGRHVMAQSVDPKRQEMITFAKRLVAFLEASRQQGEFDRLYVAAPPTFLGLLREEYSRPLSEAVQMEVAKNVSAQDSEQLRKYLPEYL